MPKQKLFDEDSEEEVSIKTENAYAKKYDTWREKEEIHKLEQKYGSKVLNSDASISSDSEDDSDEPPEISEEVEEQFLKTLSLLKTKDPRIYDPGYKFFEEKQKEEVKEEKKKTLTFADSDDDDDNDGNIFSIEKKAEIADDKEPVKNKINTSKLGKEGKLKDFLTGKVEHIEAPVERDLAPLKALWSDPALNEGEAFLRDYILNKRYLDPDAGAAEARLRDDDELEADERTVEEQGKFERAYNFRFEEPDQEYLKRFPRTMNSIRPKDDKRSRQRVEVRTRKEEEKRRKMEEIGRLKALKLKEIQDKIAKIKEVTGNEELAFKEEDIEGDFDPEEHDRRMRALFDEQYYGDVDEEKPVFPDLDDELEIENWDKFEPRPGGIDLGDDNDEPHCEDAEFNMDAEYDPRRARAALLQEIQSSLGKKRRNRKNKSKLAKLLAKEKPKYIPTQAEKNYDEYMEEYYKMDCEDVIGGELPTRFKYRDVVPNDYGLTVEEILLADDKELTQWVPLKRLVRLRAESAQQSEVAAYRQKARDLALKRRVLPSLFKDLPEEPELVVPNEAEKKQKKKKKKNKEAGDAAEVAEENVSSVNNNDEQNNESVKTEDKKKKKKNKGPNKIETSEENDPTVNDDKEQTNEAGNKDKKKKRKKNKTGPSENEENEISNENGTEDTAKRKDNEIKHVQNSMTLEESTSKNLETITKQNGGVKSKRKKKSNAGFEVENALNATPSQASGGLKRKSDNSETSQVPKKKKKSKNNASSKMQGKKNKDFKNFKKEKFKNKQSSDKTSDNPLSKLSDERLKAYGLNPKKYRSFLKYKKF